MIETIQGIPKEMVSQSIRGLLALPNEGIHEIGWRDPQTGLKENYLKLGAKLAALFGWITMTVDELGESIFEEDNVCNQIGKIKRSLGDRPERLITDKQIGEARKLGEIALAMIEGRNDQARTLWQEIKAPKKEEASA